jgi:hypothetical protein
MRHPKPAVLLLVLAAAAAIPQDLPPGVLLLSRIKRHVRQEMAALPDYTCLQTTRRFRKNSGTKGQLLPSDTLRLEVLYTGDRELYASPGDRDFHEENPAVFSGGGLTGTGIFAVFLKTIFVNNHAVITKFYGEEEQGRRIARYDYRVPLMVAAYTLTFPWGSLEVGMKGSFWVDPDTLDVLRLEVYADDILAGSPLQESAIDIRYSRTRIGDRDILLPDTAELRIRQEPADENVNLLSFTHCRSYRAESSIRFDPDAPPPVAVAPAKPQVAAAVTLPAGLLIPIKLTTPITGSDPVGSLIQGRVAADVRDRNKLLVPAGASVRGRIRRLEEYRDSGAYFVVGLEFTDLEWEGSHARFFAELQDMDHRDGIDWFLHNSASQTRRVSPDLSETTSYNETLRTAGLPGVGTFFVRAAHLNLPEGFKTTWKTSK